MRIKPNIEGSSNSARLPILLNRKLPGCVFGFLLAGVLLNGQQIPAIPGMNSGPAISPRPTSPSAGSGLPKPSSGGSGASASNVANAASVGALTDAPIFPGETVHVLVFDAPDFSIVSQVSDGGDVAVPMAGAVHVAGLNSASAEQAIAEKLQSMDLVMNPRVSVTVDTQAMGITVLGEVRNPGIYQPTGKQVLSDLLAMAGGMTGNIGRVVEISNVSTPDKRIDLPWDPTMHNTANYDTEVHPGDRVLVRPCGVAYVGGNVGHPGAYSLCGSRTTTLSQLVDLAGGVLRFNSNSHTYVVRTKEDGTRVVVQVNIDKILKAKAADLAIQDDDIVYVTPSTLKLVAVQAMGWAVTVSGPLIYVYHP